MFGNYNIVCNKIPIVLGIIHNKINTIDITKILYYKFVVSSYIIVFLRYVYLLFWR